MKTIIPLLVTIVFASVASASPIRATFSGTVSGSSGIFTTILNDFPVGTAASFDVTFDDSGLVDALPVTDLDVGPVSGWLRMGALEWLLDAGSIYSYSYMTTPGNPVTSYALQLTGTGPTISDSGALFGLFLQLTPDSAPFAGALPLAGFGYPVPGGTFYSYADLSGPFRTTAAVPEPAAGLLMGTALALRVYLRRRRSEVAAR